HGLTVRAGVSGGEFEDVRLIACRAGVGVAHQFIKLRGVHIIVPLRIVAPAIGAYLRAMSHRIVRQSLVAREWADLVCAAVENALHKQLRPGGDAQSKKGSGIRVGLSSGRISGDNSGTVRAVAISIGAVG